MEVEIQLDYFQEAMRAADEGLKCPNVAGHRAALQSLQQTAVQLIQLDNEIARIERALAYRPLTPAHCRSAASIYGGLSQNHPRRRQEAIEKW